MVCVTILAAATNLSKLVRTKVHETIRVRSVKDNDLCHAGLLLQVIKDVFLHNCIEIKVLIKEEDEVVHYCIHEVILKVHLMDKLKILKGNFLEAFQNLVLINISVSENEVVTINIIL